MSREKEILRLIEENPMISQNELADLLGITRSSVSVHITNLMKKGTIKGRGYIVDKNDYVCVIGGTSNDLQGFPSGKFKPSDSNPGSIRMSAGGVGRNISENLSKLGIRVKLLTAVGDDIYGNKLLSECESAGIDMKDTFVLRGQQTATYMSILDDEGDMIAAISHMDINNFITADMLREKKNVIDHAKVCVLDTNFDEQVLAYVLNNHKNMDFFLDPVSTTKALRVKNHIGLFHTIKLNRIEAEILSGIKINSNNDLKTAAADFISKGVRNVFITLGKDGVYYNNGDTEGRLEQSPVHVVNATGAGDAFTAALVYSHMEEYGPNEAARFSMAAAVLALSHENTINPYLNLESIKKKMEELKLC